MKLKNNKGVTLITLSIMVIVLMIISTITVSLSTGQLAIRNVNYLYSDIEVINSAISEYYLQKEDLPTLGTYCANSQELTSMTEINSAQVNPNDQGEYDVIDLSKLDNLTLNYGIEYRKWNAGDSNKYTDLYIINVTSHQVYYVEGIEMDGEKYFTHYTN